MAVNNVCDERGGGTVAKTSVTSVMSRHVSGGGDVGSKLYPLILGHSC